MKSVEAIATITEDGRITLPAPLGIVPGKCRVRVEFLNELAAPAPHRQYKGRPLYNEDDMKQMTPDLPPETDWANEHGVK